MRFLLGWSLFFGACATAPSSVSGESWEKKWGQQSEKAREKVKEEAKEKAAVRANLFIRCEPEDAEILLDGTPQGNCLDYVAKGLQIDGSTHLRKILVTKAGYWPYELMVAPDRSKMNLQIRLQPMQASEPP